MARSHRGARVRRAPVAALLVVLALMTQLPDAHARFSSVTASTGDAWTADRLAAPTDLVVTQTCSATPAIALRGTSTGTGRTSLVLSPPAATQAGDVLVAQVAHRYGPTTVTAPSGWTRVLTDTVGGQVSAEVYWKVAAAGEPIATFSRPGGSGGDMVGGIAAYSGVDTGAPVAVAGSATGTSATTTTPALTTSARDTVVLHLLTKRQEDLPAPTGTTQRWRLMSGTGTDTEGATAADEAFPGPGTTPARTSASTSGFSAEWIAQSVVLRRVAGTPSAALSWTASSSTWATGYRLDRVVGGAVQASRTLTPVGTTSTTDGPLANGVTSTYRLRAHLGTWTSPAASTSLTPAC